MIGNFKNQNLKSKYNCLFPRGLHELHRFLGENVLLKKILIPIYLPWSPNLGGVIAAKESGGNGFKSTAILLFENIGVN